MKPWRVALPTGLAAELGPDDAPGEASWLGLGVSFPHDLERATAPLEALRAAPALSADLLDLAGAAVEAYSLGVDDIPDLLAISISTTDHVGHAFGVSSWEYADALLSVDRSLGAFLRELEARTDVAVVITSDHGGADLPERTGRGGRIVPVQVAAALERELAAVLGAGDWIDAYVPPFVYLSAAAEATSARRARVTQLVEAALRRTPGVAFADPIDMVRVRPVAPADDLQRAVALSIPARTHADLIVFPGRGWVVVEDEPVGCGTGHGSPWDYDRHVPVALFGAGVASDHGPRRRIAQEDVADLLADLLGLGARWSERAQPSDG